MFQIYAKVVRLTGVNLTFSFPIINMKKMYKYDMYVEQIIIALDAKTCKTYSR